MSETTYRNRRAVTLENERLRVTVLVEGGHIAEVFDKETEVNPLWTPPWPSIEPSTYNLARHPEYGADSESKLLSGIMGHNLCLDLFGPPSEEEAAAGMTVHGEASVAPYAISVDGPQMAAKASLPVARLEFQRVIRLEGRSVRFSETLENVSNADYPVAWTQHVTLGPPFVARGETAFRAPVARSYSLDAEAEFVWPHASRDLRTCDSAPSSAGFSAHLMDPAREVAFFIAHSPAFGLVFGYRWKRSDFPWLGVWEENHSRQQPPWNGRTLTWGMEFGASPLPESRRKMIGRNGMFGERGYRWIPARSTAKVEYTAFFAAAASIPERLEEIEIDVSA